MSELKEGNMDNRPARRPRNNNNNNYNNNNQQFDSNNEMNMDNRGPRQYNNRYKI